MHQAQAEARGGIAPIKIKENYVPRAAQRAANKSQMALCPNCKQQIPINELDEHMRSEFAVLPCPLSDPITNAHTQLNFSEEIGRAHV